MTEKRVDTCWECRRSIYEGEAYYDISAHILCEDCGEEYLERKLDEIRREHIRIAQ